MMNRYFAPCRYCGGTVSPDSGTVEKVGQSWQAAHLPCAEAHLGKALFFTGGSAYPSESPFAAAALRCCVPE